MIKQIKIGNIELNNNVFLAPMAGITDLPYRKLCKEFGAGLTYSEMVSAKGMYYNDEKTNLLTEKAENEHPFCYSNIWLRCRHNGGSRREVKW